MGLLKCFLYLEFSLVRELESGQTSLVSLGSSCLACANWVACDCSYPLQLYGVRMTRDVLKQEGN